ncbi:MAG: hypothetical protein H7067_14175 [Burkholderiales bacterium]|nr:hypothetical protein [Opitutaceae bacterium]
MISLRPLVALTLLAPFAASRAAPPATDASLAAPTTSRTSSSATARWPN